MTEVKYLTTKQAAEYLGYSEYTLRRARVEGEKLGGKAGPDFVKFGSKSVRYTQESLDKWIRGE